MMARDMAAGSLAPTAYADDEGAIQWFVSAFMQFSGGEMTEASCAALLSDENCQKWRETETRTVVKEWIIGLLENCPESIREIAVPRSQKKSP